MQDDTRKALVERLGRYEPLVEVGIGRRTAVARTLVEQGRRVIATDIHERSVPTGISFVRDDITDPDLAIYADADAVYALNCPRELQPHVAEVATRVGATFLFTTLGTDSPVVPVRRESLPGETLYWALSDAGPLADDDPDIASGGETP